MVTKELLLLFIWTVGTYQFVEANVPHDRHRLARQTGDASINTEVRFIMFLDEYADILLSREETTKLLNYLADNDFFKPSATYLPWVLRYVTAHRTTYELPDDLFEVEEEAYFTLFHWQILVEMLIVFADAGPYFSHALEENEEPNEHALEVIEECNELLATVTWCKECTAFNLPDTKDRVEIIVLALEAYQKKLYHDYDCASKYLKSAKKPVLALPPTSTSEGDWYYQRYEAMLSYIEEQYADCIALNFFNISTTPTP